MVGPIMMDDDSDDDSDTDTDNESNFFEPGSPALSPGHKRAQHEAWLPFAQFLGQLPGLTDLVYSCTHQVPACVLTALHQHHPKSRLHVRTFSLRSLYQERDQLHDIDPDEFALATSPCLYSIRAKCAAYDGHGRFSFNLEALKHIVTSRCAPGLRHLSVHHTTPPGTISLLEAIRAPRDSWKGFFRSHHGPNQPTTDSLQQSPTVPERARLETLVLSGNFDGLYHLEAWHSRIDISALTRFELYGDVSIQALHTLASMAARSNFSSLRELGLTIPLRQRNRPWSLPLNDDGHETTSSPDQPAGLFLQAVPPLAALTLNDPHHADDEDDDVDADAEQARTIQQRWPRLEDVQLRVRRRQGGPEEVAVYRTLGRLPRLRRATVVLDCRVPLSDSAGGAERLRKTFVNLGPGAPLQRLKLETRAKDAVDEQYPEVRDWIGMDKEEGDYLRDELGVLRAELEQFEYDCQGAEAGMSGGNLEDGRGLHGASVTRS
ncbi:hypothetical protein VTG60DRAFT_2021 [Thermothelomyces hinnuleus]